MIDQTFVAFDTETTGLWAPANRIIEIGAVKFCLKNRRKETFQALINPKREIPENVIKIHGITNEMVADKEEIEPILNKFIEFCGQNSILMAHNAAFDISFINCEMERIGMSLPANPILDTIDIFKKVFPKVESYALLSLAQKFKIADSQNHRALADAELVRRLFLKASKKLLEIESVEVLLKTFSEYKMSDWHQVAEKLPANFKILMDAKEKAQKVRIFYSLPGERTHLRDVWPKQFYALRSKFYMRAYCERAKHERTFRLDRIKDFEIIQE